MAKVRMTTAGFEVLLFTGAVFCFPPISTTTDSVLKQKSIQSKQGTGWLNQTQLFTEAGFNTTVR